jgi:ferredoxin-nitrate reductase
MTRTGKVERLLEMEPEPLLEVHPDDAEVAGLSDGELALISSRRGSLTAKVAITRRIRPGMVFLPMHWGAAQATPCEANRLMHELGCPISKQPELKAAAVCLEPVDS